MGITWGILTAGHCPTSSQSLLIMKAGEERAAGSWAPALLFQAQMIDCNTMLAERDAKVARQAKGEKGGG
jgi:hypothetical protein